MYKYKYEFERIGQEGTAICKIGTNYDYFEDIVRRFQSKKYKQVQCHSFDCHNRGEYIINFLYEDYVSKEGGEELQEFQVYKSSSDVDPDLRMRGDRIHTLENPQSVTTFQGDIRRVLANIIFVFYGFLAEDRDAKIESLEWNGTVYTNIRPNVCGEEDELYITFEAETEDGVKRSLLLPIPLNGYKSRSACADIIYVLQDENTKRKLKPVFSNRIGVERIYAGNQEYYLSKEESYFVWGEDDDGRKGLFYWHGDKLVPFYAVNIDKGDFVYTDGHTRFYEPIEEITIKASPEELRDIVSSECESFEEAEKLVRSYVHHYTKFQETVMFFLRDEEYTGVRCQNTYGFSEIELDGWKITGTVQVQQENGEYVIANEDKTKISIEKGDGDVDLCLKPSTLKYKEGLENELEIEWDKLKELRNPLNKNEKVILDRLGDIIESCLNVAKDFVTLIEDETILEKLKKEAVSETDPEIMEAAEKLYREPLIPDLNVASIVYEAKEKYRATGKVPNFVIMGGPGSGKTTLVGKIAAYLFGDGSGEENVLMRSVSDLKGAYVGQTANRVFELLQKAGDERKIVFIDEAYNLQADRFGKEALEMLLPLMSGDRKEIECVDLTSNNKGDIKSYRFVNGVPGIWMAGYEHEMRKMLSENPGLYRRMIKIALSEPTVEGLYSNLLEKAKNDEELYTAFSVSCKEAIKSYFGWASAKEHVEYFGNYAGVEDFYQSCKVRTEKTESVERCIKKIIDEKKREIKKQYKAILTEIEVPKFEVQRDVTEKFKNIKGNERMISGMEQIATMLMRREVYEREGIRVPKGALLVGPPGTGKTMLARALAGEIQSRYNDAKKIEKSVAFIPVAATELNTAKKVSALFAEASEYDSSVIFIDEIDVIGRQRETNSNPEVLIQLMKEMDGFEERKNIFVMAATNAPEVLDPALKRPGRFDREIEMDYPEDRDRRDMLRGFLEKLTRLVEGIKKDNNEKETIDELAGEIADRTVGFSPAELKNLVNEAAILYKWIEDGNGNVCERHRTFLQPQTTYQRFRADVLEVLERLEIGDLVEGNKETEFKTDKNEGSSATAIHEVGHALVSVMLGMEPFEKITLISRGDALGYVAQSRKNKLRTKEDYLKRIRVCLGGRIAEEIFYEDNISVGAVQDIQQASACAENMVMLYGMSDEIGPMALKTYQNSYLGSGQSYRCSDEFRCKAEEEIKSILKAQLAEVRGMLKSQKKLIETLAEHVFKKETLTGEEFQKAYEKARRGEEL